MFTYLVINEPLPVLNVFFFSEKTPLHYTRLSMGRRYWFHLTGKELRGGRITTSSTAILLLSMAPSLKLSRVFIPMYMLQSFIYRTLKLVLSPSSLCFVAEFLGLRDMQYVSKLCFMR